MMHVRRTDPRTLGTCRQRVSEAPKVQVLAGRDQTSEFAPVFARPGSPIPLTRGDRRNPRTSARHAYALATRPSLSYLEEELVRRNEERVLLQDPADDHHRVRPHDVHGHARAEFRQIVRAHHRIVVLGEHVVEAWLVFDHVLDTLL